MDYQQWLREAISQLQTSESPRRDAEILLEFVTGKGRTFILAFGETVLTEAQHQRLGTLLERRQRCARGLVPAAVCVSGYAYSTPGYRVPG